MSGLEKPLGWLHWEVKSPPLSSEARREAGFLLRRLQRGERLSMPQSRAMPRIGPRCHELRIKDAGLDWRIVYRTDPDAVLIVDVFEKKTRTTPHEVIEKCKRRLRDYDHE